MLTIPFDNQYINLGDGFYVKTRPVSVVHPALINFNEPLAQFLGISATTADSDELASVFSGNVIVEGAEPVAMAYAGHQFGHFVPQLGDGRAILLGEVRGEDDKCYGIHFKGSGRTHFSRNGDGRSALGPVLREYLVSEAMAKLNIPTTRALAAVTTGEEVARDQFVAGGIITRVAASFVRVGSFEYFYAREEIDNIRKLAGHVIKHHYPDSAKESNPYVALLQAVVERQAALIAQWMHIGFIHGVMNTDNMSVAGETIDYGPCAFMDAFSHSRVYSSIDRQGRYAYGNQPAIGLWNLSRLAECLLPLFADDTDVGIGIAQDVLKSYIDFYEHYWLEGMRAKCGLTPGADTASNDKALIESLLDTMEKNHADFTLTFRYLSGLASQSNNGDGDCRKLFDNPQQFDAWAEKWRQRLSKEPVSDDQRQEKMKTVNPLYIPRNHQIEAAIRAAEDRSDFSVFHELHKVLNNPFNEQAGKERYQLPPTPEEEVKQTFCGT